MSHRYFEDYRPGQTLRSGTYRVTADEIVAFATRYDPQPSHVGEAAAAASAFGRLVASGWHTAAITMRLFVDCDDFGPDGSSLGAGVDELRWMRPVLPGDELSATIAVVAARPSKSNPGRGLVTVRIETRNDRDEVVQTMQLRFLAPRREGTAAPERA